MTKKKKETIKPNCQNWFPVSFTSIVHTAEGNSIRTICGFTVPLDKERFYLEHFEYRRCKICESVSKKIAKKAAEKEYEKHYIDNIR